MPEWLDVLNLQIKEKGSRTVAAELGYGASSIRLAKIGKYTCSTHKLAAKVLEIYCGTITCPFDGKNVTQEQCEVFLKMKMPTSSPEIFRKWQTCQTCQGLQNKKERSEV